MFAEKDNQYSVVCHAKVAKDCVENGAWCDSEEEAQDWVENECWIYSGEGWFCLQCNLQFMQNLSKNRRDNGLNSMTPDGWDDNLEKGIPTVL